MYSKFGEFNSASEINELAVNLRREGDIQSLKDLAEENGIDVDIVDVFMSGDILFLCDDMAAAIGKIEVEAEELKPVEIIEDWVEYIKAQCVESEELAKGVRRKNKSLKGCIAELLSWSFKNCYEIDKSISAMAGIKSANVKMGIPGVARVKKIISAYYEM